MACILILAIADRSIQIPRERVTDVLLEAALAQVKLLALIKIIIKHRRAYFVGRLNQILQFFQMVDLVDNVRDIGVPRRLDFDRHRVAKIGGGINVASAAITCVSDHNSHSNPKKDKYRASFPSSSNTPTIVQRIGRGSQVIRATQSTNKREGIDFEAPARRAGALLGIEPRDDRGQNAKITD
jgi:hypothetical protein